MKQTYIELMNKVVYAYSEERIEDYVNKVLAEGLSEHGFPRLTANIGILIAHGYRCDLNSRFEQMMDICCEQIPKAMAKHPKVGNNFSVKEIVLCLLELEKNHTFPKQKTMYWRELLSSIKPEMCYSNIAQNVTDKMHNWAAFGAASEQARKFAGLGREDGYIDTQIASQLLSFDENGMYRDPNEPVVYDLTTRLQLSLAMFLGYNGPYRERLEELLEKGAENTVYMQSVTGEIPYGGRSNQFLHNESVLVALMEYEASRSYKTGDVAKARRFKGSAQMAREAIERYLKEGALYHIKNFYPQDSMYGCENYAYFDKYMVTTASFLFLAYLFASDEIEAMTEERNFIFHTSKHFHKAFLRFGDYFAEYDTCANFHYDANGLGRIHKKGAPSAICLSTPCTVDPSYHIDIENINPLTICWGVMQGDEYIYSCEAGTQYELLKNYVNDKEAVLKWNCTLKNGQSAMETCTISDEGVKIHIQSENDIYFMLPVFLFDGKNTSKIECVPGKISIYYQNWICCYHVTGELMDTEKQVANRNGHYAVYRAKGNHELEVSIEMYKMNE